VITPGNAVVIVPDLGLKSNHDTLADAVAVKFTAREVTLVTVKVCGFAGR